MDSTTLNIEFKQPNTNMSSTQTTASTKHVRKNNLVVCTNGPPNQVAKILEIVDRRVDNAEKHVRESMSVIKVHCTGQFFVVPTKDLRKATDEEKKTINGSFGSTTINLAKVHYVTRTTRYYP